MRLMVRKKMNEEHTAPKTGLEIECDQRNGIKHLRMGSVTLGTSKENENKSTKCGLHQNEIQNLSQDCRASQQQL